MESKDDDYAYKDEGVGREKKKRVRTKGSTKIEGEREKGRW